MYLDAQEQAELERSAQEAASLSVSPADPSDVARYISPHERTALPLEYAFYLAGDLQGKIVLDYGCGSGQDAVLLAAKGGRVVGTHRTCTETSYSEQFDH
jgi:predicted RNA methylase